MLSLSLNSFGLKHSIVKPKKKNIVRYRKYYVNDIDLSYHLILSQGKGVPTNELYLMLFKICEKLSNVFYFRYKEDKEDAIGESFINILNNYKNFNKNKYDKSLPYITELAKRGMVNFYRKNYISRKSMDLYFEDGSIKY